MRIITRFLTPLVLLLAMLLPTAGASAAPAQTERTENFHGMFNDCNGESMVLEGTFHLVSKEQKDGSFFAHAKIFGKAVASGGNEYVLNLRGQAQQESSDNFWFEDRTLLISKGPAPNELIMFRFDSDTGITVEIECRGTDLSGRNR